LEVREEGAEEEEEERLGSNQNSNQIKIAYYVYDISLDLIK
jgi:hypothetical protein